MITEDTLIGDLKNVPGFAAFFPYLNVLKAPADQAVTKLRICDLASFSPAWSGDIISSGLENLYQKSLKGQVFHDLGTAQLFGLPVKETAPFVVVCAGGAYESVVSFCEGFPIAKALNDMGLHAFVLNYRVGDGMRTPDPLDDLAAAVRYITNHAESLGVEPDGYAIAGFSAGGHLAASFGTANVGAVSYGLPNPAALLLGYPLVSMIQDAHEGCVRNYFGEGASHALREAYSVESHVDADYPPVYVWYCDQDATLNPIHSRRLTQALRVNGVPVIELSVPGNGHGWGLGTGTDAEGWLPHAVRFFMKVRRQK